MWLKVDCFTGFIPKALSTHLPFPYYFFFSPRPSAFSSLVLSFRIQLQMSKYQLILVLLGFSVLGTVYWLLLAEDENLASFHHPRLTPNIYTLIHSSWSSLFSISYIKVWINIWWLHYYNYVNIHNEVFRMLLLFYPFYTIFFWLELIIIFLIVYLVF